MGITLNDDGKPETNVWKSKPAWCQPWTIVATGVAIVGGEQVSHESSQHYLCHRSACQQVMVLTPCPPPFCPSSQLLPCAAGSFAVFHSKIFSGVVSVPIVLWWYLFLGVMPGQYADYVLSISQQGKQSPPRQRDLMDD